MELLSIFGLLFDVDRLSIGFFNSHNNRHHKSENLGLFRRKCDRLLGELSNSECSYTQNENKVKSNTVDSTICFNQSVLCSSFLVGYIVYWLDMS